MDPRRRQLLTRSWATLEPRGHLLADVFYGHLFAIAPASRQMFAHSAMDQQREKFVAMMRSIVELEDDASALVATIAALARRHVTYGVQDADYDTALEALMRTLEDELGAELTPELRGVWTEWLVVVMTLMRRAAARPQPSVS
jgi:hemoglobin-like flavoprotein